MSRFPVGARRAKADRILKSRATLPSNTSITLHPQEQFPTRGTPADPPEDRAPHLVQLAGLVEGEEPRDHTDGTDLPCSGKVRGLRVDATAKRWTDGEANHGHECKWTRMPEYSYN